MDTDALEDWSNRVVQLLQEICDDAQGQTVDPDGDTECRDIRELLEEHSKIMQGKPL